MAGGRYSPLIPKPISSEYVALAASFRDDSQPIRYFTRARAASIISPGTLSWGVASPVRSRSMAWRMPCCSSREEIPRSPVLISSWTEFPVTFAPGVAGPERIDWIQYSRMYSSQVGLWIFR